MRPQTWPHSVLRNHTVHNITWHNHMIWYDIISYHSEVLRSKYGSPVRLIDLMLKLPGSIMFHKISFKPHPWPNGGWIVLGIDLGQSSGDFSGMWATGILLQDSFGESFGDLGDCPSNDSQITSSPFPSFRTAWKSEASRAQPVGCV